MTEEIKKIKKSGKKIIAGFALGTIAGIIGGILFAPKKGEETRKEIKNKIDKNKFTQEVIKKTEKLTEITKEKYSEIIEEVSGFYKKAKKIKEENLKEIVDELKNRWPEISKKLKTKSNSKK
jgi:gas vesicle protein